MARLEVGTINTLTTAKSSEYSFVVFLRPAVIEGRVDGEPLKSAFEPEDVFTNVPRILLPPAGVLFENLDPSKRLLGDKFDLAVATVPPECRKWRWDVIRNNDGCW